VTVVMTTHDLAHVEKACDQVVVIKAGRAIAQGAPGELHRRSHEIEALASGAGLSEELLAGLQRDGVIRSFQLAGGAARMACDAVGRKRLGGELVRRGVELEELRSLGASLEDAFLDLMGRDGA
jgi:ABC-2 type transport system ATP-binding protein